MVNAQTSNTLTEYLSDPWDKVSVLRTGPSVQELYPMQKKKNTKKNKKKTHLN